MPFLVLGNKLDMEGARKVSIEEGKQFCLRSDLIFFETSAKDNTNINEAFKELVPRILKRQEDLSKMFSDINSSKSASSRTMVTNNLRGRAQKDNVVLNSKKRASTTSKSRCCK